jgi:hypothetical protein
VSSRLSVAILALALPACAAVGLLAGESPDLIGLLGVFAAVFVVPIVIAIVIWALGRSMAWSRKRSLVAGALCGLSFGAAALVGSSLQGDAYNRCQSEGLLVQRRIEVSATARGRYPKSLTELGSPALPCQIPIRGSLLRYESDGKTYRLWFTDSFVTHEATDHGEGFFASK